MAAAPVKKSTPISPRERNPLSQRHIVRIDHKSTHGFQVRVPLRPTPLSRFFADGLCGGKQKSLKTAKAWRDTIFKQHGLNPNSRRSIRHSNARNQTGVVGVSVQWITKGEYQYKHYVVSWCPKPYVQKKKVFSAHKYGDDQAREIAIRFRKDREQQILA